MNMRISCPPMHVYVYVHVCVSDVYVYVCYGYVCVCILGCARQWTPSPRHSQQPRGPTSGAMLIMEANEPLG